MRILSAARTLPFHSAGGMQAIAWDVLTGLARHGHEVTVLTTHIPGRAETFECDGVNVVALAQAQAERYTGAWWRESRRYACERMGGSVDAVLSISTAAAGLIALKRTALPVPFVLQAHGTSWGSVVSKWRSCQPLEWLKSSRNLWWIPKDLALYRHFDRVVLVGEGLRGQFSAAPVKWSARAEATTVIPNGIDTSLFRAHPAMRAQVRAEIGWDTAHRVVVFAARLHAQKGAAEAIRAFALLGMRAPEHRLLIVGDGREAAKLRQLCSELGCARRVHFTGAVSRTRVAALLSAADVFVFPSLCREGLPLNVLEALSVGLPCVCSESLRAVFGAELPIHYVDPEHPVELAAALERAQPGTTAKSLLPERFSLEHCIESYVDVLERLRRH